LNGVIVESSYALTVSVTVDLIFDVLPIIGIHKLLAAVTEQDFTTLLHMVLD